MTSTRRLWIYGLLLLLSALGVGGVAMGLLMREQERLQAREQTAYETRSSAVADRARIIAENIELLVGDVQNALMTTLKEAPADSPRAFLAEWQTYNPLVRDVFRATADGRPVWGAGSDSLREWIVSAPWRQDEPVGGFEGRALANQVSAPQYREAEAAVAPSAALAQAQIDDSAARREISQNVVQYQNVRRSLEEVAKLKSAPATSLGSAASSLTSAIAQKSEPQTSQMEPAQPAAPAADYAAFDNDAPVMAGRADQVVGFTDVLSEQKESDKQVDAFAAKDEATTVAGASLAAPAAKPDRTGWAWLNAADGPHRFGWRELPDGTVIGLELRLEAIKARLRDVFPANLDDGEFYQLRDAAGRVWEGRDAVLAGAPLFTIPLSADVLPGWTIVAHFDDLRYGSSDDGGFLFAGTAIVALLVGAILLSGALLLLQARRSEIEAAQKTSFVANVSHEFKTPLTTIRLYSELLAEGRVSDETKRTDYLRTIGSETQRLARLVGNVLDFSRLEQGQKKFELQSLDVAAELRGLLDAHAPRLADSGLTLAMDIPDQPCPQTTDRDALQQIVLNLLDNACKYAATGGEVSVSLVCAADGATIRVGDRGPGVPVAQRERIFEKFHRIDDRLTAANAGTGLGLSIARQLARGLGGDLSCAARDGGGAEFILTLPSSLTTNGSE